MTNRNNTEQVEHSLLEEALAEEDLQLDLGEVVHVLRRKGFSWRKMSKWLKERGVEISHSQLYRRYKDT